MTSIVAIVGRPNVGKSTLFNRLSKSRDSLVDNKPGVTRDRLYASILWGDTPFTIIDTGGFEDIGQDPLLNKIRKQVEFAIEESDLIIFMTDGRQGLLPGDEEMAQTLRMTNKKVFIVINKIDGVEHEHLANEFFRLGVGKVYPISAAHGYGLKTLMGDIIQGLPKQKFENKSNTQVRVSVLGRPNSGKSSLINRILGLDRLLVSELPGTTRDSIDTVFKWGGREYLLIDTAGIRRRGKVKEKIDRYSMIKAIKSLDRCHIAVVLIDANTGVAEQDARICGYALDRGRGLVLAVNKWDLIKKEGDKRKRLKSAIERQLQFISFAPRINLSALTGERVKKLFDKINLVYDQFNYRISTGKVNKAIEEMIQQNPPPVVGKGRLKFLYATQVRVRPPTFVVFVNKPDMVHFSYERFMVNRLRQEFDLDHTPIKLVFRKKKKD